MIVFTDSKAELGSIPLFLNEKDERQPASGRFPEFHLPEAILNLMLVNKYFYTELSSLLFQESVVIPPRRLFRFVHQIPSVPNHNTQTFDLIHHLQLRVAFSLGEKEGISLLYDARNLEDVDRFQEFRDWFGRLRSVRLQVGFHGGQMDMRGAKRNIVKRIMRCAGVFSGLEVLIFAEESENCYDGLLRGVGVREQTIKEIIGECRKMLFEQNCQARKL